MNNINLNNYEAFLIDYHDGNLSAAVLIELKAFIIANPQLEISLSDLDLPHLTKDSFKIDFKSTLKKTEPVIEDEELLNYFENNLSRSENKLFENKLTNDLELKSKLNAYKKTVLIKDLSISLESKQELKKTEDELIANNITLAYYEAQLNDNDKVIVEKEFLSNPTFKKDLMLFSKTKLIADNSIIFPNKNELKKEVKLIPLFSFKTVAALAASILLLIGLTIVFNYYYSKPILNKEIAKTDVIKNLKNVENELKNTQNNKNKLNQFNSNTTNAIVKSEKPIKKANFYKKDFITNSVNTNSVAINEVPNKNDFLINNDSSSTFVNAKLALDTSKAKLVNANSIQTKNKKQNYLIIEEADELEGSSVASEKKGFWQRAVKLAKQINKFGIKSIDGEETVEKNYSLSFNSFNVQKR